MNKLLLSVLATLLVAFPVKSFAECEANLLYAFTAAQANAICTGIGDIEVGSLDVAGAVTFGDANTSIQPDVNQNLQYDVATGDAHTFRVNDSNVTLIQGDKVRIFQNLALEGSASEIQHGGLVFQPGADTVDTFFKKAAGSTILTLDTGTGDLVMDATNGGYVKPTYQLLTATGSAQGDAAQITKQMVLATGSTGTEGIKLPDADGQFVFIINGASSAVLLYPASGDSINASAANASVSLAANGAGVMCFARPAADNNFRCMEAPAA